MFKNSVCLLGVDGFVEEKKKKEYQNDAVNNSHFKRRFKVHSKNVPNNSVTFQSDTRQTTAGETLSGNNRFAFRVINLHLSGGQIH